MPKPVAIDTMNQQVPYLTTREAASYIRLSPRTLEKRRMIGGGPRFHKVLRKVFYLREDLDQLVRARAAHTTSDPEYAAGLHER